MSQSRVSICLFNAPREFAGKFLQQQLIVIVIKSELKFDKFKFKMAQCTTALDDLIIKQDVLSKIFSFEGNNCIGLNKNEYRDILCEEFLIQFKNTVNIKWGRGNKQSIVIDLYCASKHCQVKYKISKKKSEIALTNEQVNLSVKSNGHQCYHEDEKLIRQLRGTNRENIAKQVKQSSVDLVRNDAIIEGKNTVSSGNLNNIYTKAVLRKAASEFSAKNDKSSDSLFDVFLQSNHLKFVNSIEYKFNKFNVLLISEEQIQILSKYITNCKRNNELTRLHYDATGGILAKPNEDINNLFNHVIIIPHKFHEIDSVGSHINIGEMITSLHTSDQQEIFLRKFLQLARKQIKSKGNFFL